MYRAQIQVLPSEKDDVTNMVLPRNQRTLQIWTMGCQTIQLYRIVKKKQLAQRKNDLNSFTSLLSLKK